MVITDWFPKDSSIYFYIHEMISLWLKRKTLYISIETLHKSWSQRKKFGVVYSKFGVNENSDI